MRTVELRKADAALANQHILWSISDWGMGEDGFLSAVQARFNETGCPTYRFDLSDYSSRDEFLAETQERFGVPFEVLCANISTVGSSYVLFNDIPVDLDVRPGSQPIEIDVEGIAQIIKEFSPKTKIVLRASRPPRRMPTYPILELKALDEADVAIYLRECGNGGEALTKADAVSAIYQHTDGVPSRIDLALRELAVSSLETVVRANTDRGDRMLPMSVPPALVAAVSQVQTAQKEGSGYPFDLLIALASLPRGDQIEGIERLNGPKRLRHLDAVLLSDRGLIDTVPLTGLRTHQDRTGAKTLMVPRPVREYVRDQLSDMQIESLDRKMIELFFGKNWKTGKITGSRGAKSASDSLCDMHVIVNCGALVIRHLRRATEKRNLVETEAGIRLASAFIEYLVKGSHHRAAAALCADIIELTPSDGYDRQKNILEYELARSLRMTKKTIEARDLILNLDMSMLSKAQRQSANLSLALAYQTLGDDEKSAHAAREVIKLDGRSSAALHAKSILVEKTKDETLRLAELEKLRARSAKKEAFVNANNIGITMAREKAKKDPEEAQRLLREVIDSARQRDDFYNGARAIADLAALHPAGEVFDVDDKVRLIDAYHFAHNERQARLFDQCHSGLWKVFEAEGDIENLLSLYRSSSFIWRINGRDDVESNYLTKLRDFKGRMDRASSDRDYFFVRIVVVFGEAEDNGG